MYPMLVFRKTKNFPNFKKLLLREFRALQAALTWGVPGPACLMHTYCQLILLNYCTKKLNSAQVLQIRKLMLPNGKHLMKHCECCRDHSFSNFKVDFRDVKKFESGRLSERNWVFHFLSLCLVSPKTFPKKFPTTK